MSLLVPDDEADLLWFFSRGQTVFERSIMGTVLERGYLYSLENRWWEEPPEVTARPTAEVHSQANYVQDDQILNRYAVISRRLTHLCVEHELSARVLEAYWGDIGGRWAGTKQGRAFAVYHFTAAGKKLLRNATDKLEGKELDLAAHERMGVQVELQVTQPEETRKQALARVDREAELLYRAACKDWNATPVARSWRR